MGPGPLGAGVLAHPHYTGTPLREPCSPFHCRGLRGPLGSSFLSWDTERQAARGAPLQSWGAGHPGELVDIPHPPRSFLYKEGVFPVGILLLSSQELNQNLTSARGVLLRAAAEPGASGSKRPRLHPCPQPWDLPGVAADVGGGGGQK